MSRSRLCRACNDFHDLEQPWPQACYGHFKVTASSAPNIRTDGMDPVQSMVTGEFFDSRSRYYGHVKERGLEIVGNDFNAATAAPNIENRPIAPDIKRALEELRSR